MEENVTPEATPPAWRADAGGGAGQGDGPTDDEEEQQFDISLPATHSYMGSGLVSVRGRTVLEAGWEGCVPALAHHGTVFPGEIVPMNITDGHNSLVFEQIIRSTDRLFVLLSPDETGALVSGYGVLCEVFETSEAARRQAAAGTPRPGLALKARAINRVRFVDFPSPVLYMHMYARMQEVRVRVLAERGGERRGARLHSLDPHRRAGRTQQDMRLRRMDALLTPWPHFVYDTFDCARMREVISDYFANMNLGQVPEDAVALSFWVASNLPMAARDRLALLVLDDAAQRLHFELRIMQRNSVLCCCSCTSEITRLEDVVPMSSDGLHSNYTNIGGFVHDVVTVGAVGAGRAALSGRATAAYSWFPGYAWTVALCAGCDAHLGWRFDALKKTLRPQQFYALCRNYVQPRGALPAAERDADALE